MEVEVNVGFFDVVRHALGQGLANNIYTYIYICCIFIRWFKEIFKPPQHSHFHFKQLTRLRLQKNKNKIKLSERGVHCKCDVFRQ